MEAPNPTPRSIRPCVACGLVVGTYEPAAFVFASQVIHGSRASEPGLAAEPGCRLMHRDCFTEHGPGPHLQLVPNR